MNRQPMLIAVCISLSLVCAILALLPARADASQSDIESATTASNTSLAATTVITVNFPGDAPDYDLADGRCDTQKFLAFDQCTIRAAIQNANATAGPVTIIVPAGTWELTHTGSGEDAAATGDLDITKDVTIVGAGAGSTIIQWSPAVANINRDNVFHVVAGNATINGVTIQGAVGSGWENIRVNLGSTLNLNSVSVTGNQGNGSSGTAVSNAGALIVSGSTITANNQDGIYNTGTATVTNSLVTANASIGFSNPGAALIANSTISSNGRGVYNGGALTITSSALISNTITQGLGNGAGLYQATGTAALVNSTVSGNTVGDSGGGMALAGGTLTLNNVTIADNTADSDQINGGDGGGIFISGGTLNIKNSIIAGNHDYSPTTKKADCSGTIISQGYNLIQDTTGCTINGATTGNLLGVDPKLGPLQNNGGATFTHALLPGSLAIDAGNPAAPGSGGDACAASDQRGVSHLMDGDNDGTPRCDVGAYEFLALHVNSPNDAVDASIGDGVCASGTGECTLRAAIQESNFWPGEDLIFVPLGTYSLTIFGPNESNGASGDLNVNDSVTIVGAGAGNTIIQGTAGWNDRIFDIANNIKVEMAGITVRNGSPGLGTFDDNLGGGIATGTGVLMLNDSVISGNAAGHGGGISSFGTVIANHTTISGNVARYSGGGLRIVGSTSSVSLTNSFILSNSVTGGAWGGGMNTDGRLLLSNTLVMSNTAPDVGGIVVNASATIRNSSISNNHATFSGPGGVFHGIGLAVFDNVTVMGNTAADDGGGIYNADGLVLNNSAVLSNSARFGAGILSSGALTLTNSIVSGNRATDPLAGGGGGIINYGRLILINSSISSNSAASFGGGVVNYSMMTATNSTVSGNAAKTDGGGIYLFTHTVPFISSVNLNNVTISNNSADSDGDGSGNGGGLFVNPTATVTMKNTLIAANHDNSPTTKEPDCHNMGTVTSQGYSLIGDGTGCPVVITGGNGDQFGTAANPIDAKLGPLQNNGGPTPTHALLADSPAIDAANPGGCTDSNGMPLITDQRGYLRPVDGNNDGMARCDIGAFEFAPLKVYLPLIVR